MSHIDYYFGTVSPFSYLAGTRMEEIAARHGATVTYKPLDLIALFGRTGGVPPKDRHESRRAYRLVELRRQSERTGLPINLQPAHWPTNPAPSSYAVIAAQKAARDGAGGDLGALCHGILRACWAEERDVAEDAVIADCLESAGFDRALATSGMMAGAEEYAANLEEAVRRGVFGAPFYLVGDKPFWGQDRLDELDRHLAGAGTSATP
jgi:2-hydroxychromene-2-carboxylate isomerase